MNIDNTSSTYQLDFEKLRKRTQTSDIQSLELYLTNIFKNLYQRENNEREEQSIEKITFIEYMNLPYIVGEKLFNVFDSNKNGFLNRNEFVSGIINLYSGSLQETEKVIFNLLDFDFDGKIIPEDSRLLISFIKSLADPPNEIIKKLKPRTTLTDEENLAEINILINNFFGHYKIMNFEEFKNQIENHNSDVFFLFICFLYNNKPYFDSSIRVMRACNKSNANLNTSRNSIFNTSFENFIKNDNMKSRFKSPSKIFKSFISDLIDVDFEELEKSCEDIFSSDNEKKSDYEDFQDYLINENCKIKSIPQFRVKIHLNEKKLEKDYIRANTKNKNTFGNSIIRKSFKNYQERLDDFKANTMNSKELIIFSEKNTEAFNISNKISLTNCLKSVESNNNENHIKNSTNKEKMKEGSYKPTLFKKKKDFINNNTNWKTNTLDCDIGKSPRKFTSGDELSDNRINDNFLSNVENSNNKNLLFCQDGTGGPFDKLDSSNSKNGKIEEKTYVTNKINTNVNKSHIDTDDYFNTKYKNKRIARDENVYPKIEILGQNNRNETIISKNEVYQSKKAALKKMSYMSVDSKYYSNIKVCNISSGNVNRLLSPDSTMLSTNGDILVSDIAFEGYIYRSDENNFLNKYFAVLVGNDLFFFTNSKKSTLKGIHNLSGTYIFRDRNSIKVREESSSSKMNNIISNLNNKSNNNTSKNHNSTDNHNKQNNNPNFAETSQISYCNSDLNKKYSTINNNNNYNSHTVIYYAFKLFFKKKCRIYYCCNEDDVKSWVENIRLVTKFREITDYYIFAEDLGQGKFGQVKLGYPKKNISINNGERTNNIYNYNFKDKNFENSEKRKDENEKDKEKIAIKIIKKVNLKSIELELVKSEVEIMKFCRFRNIVKIIENFEDHENIYIILEYLSGGNLNNYLSSQKTLLSEEKIKNLILQIACGVQYIHHFGIIHRDLKPENIMLSDKSDNAILKIVDFGLSKVLGKYEKSNESYGTLAYAAPEVIQKTAYNKTVDIWSLAVILYFLISGQFPFQDVNNNLRKIAHEITSGEIKFQGNNWKKIDEDAKDLVLKCLERDMSKRIDINKFLNHKWFKKLN